MSEKIYLHLLLLCVILCQAVSATLSDNDIRVSTDSLVRKRRVINNMPGAARTFEREAVNYIVKIKEDYNEKCAGTILSIHTVITAALCIQRHVSQYKVLSGSVYDHRSNGHNVTSSATYFGSQPHQPIDGIALLTVDPRFVYGPNVQSLHLQQASLRASTIVTVSGWGCTYPLLPGRESRPQLHSITLPIMNHAVCQNIYRINNGEMNISNAFVTDKHICTYHVERYCARKDEGAPLVYHNMLAGVHVFKGEHIGRVNPDVFINVQRSDYRDWINANLS